MSARGVLMVVVLALATALGVALLLTVIDILEAA